LGLKHPKVAVDSTLHPALQSAVYLRRSRPMGYVDSILQPDETVRHRGQLHWIIFARAGAMALLAVALIIVAETYDQAVRPVIWFAAAAMLLAFYFLVAALIDVLTTEIAITTRRVIVKNRLDQTQH
jgi:hypothetical protein